MGYDSTSDTLKHSLRVGELMVQAIGELCFKAGSALETQIVED